MLQEFKASRISTLGGRVVSPTHRPLFPPGDIRGTYFFQSLRRPQCRSAPGTVKSMKNSYNSNGNQTRDRPAFSALLRRVPQNPSAHYPNQMS